MSYDRALAVFFAARLDEDEAAANTGARRVGMPWRAEPQPGTPGGLVIDELGLVGSTGGRYAAEHIARHDPARVLREIEADRALLAKLRQVEEFGEQLRVDTEILILRQVIAIRAAIWNDHPDYEGWLQ